MAGADPAGDAGKAVEVGFYQCTRMAVAEAAARLAAKAIGQGARLLVSAADAPLAELDRLLWTIEPASFLAHGLAGSGHEGDQPILLQPAAGPVASPVTSPASGPANGAGMLLLIEEALPAGFDSYGRVFLLFGDGTAAAGQARRDWKALSGRAGVRRSYWRQTERGGWAPGV